MADEVVRAHAAGRPVLVGTLTVEESERLGPTLRARGVACQVLNAKEDEHEARIVAAAGAPGAVTIATNMAGRGTDIRLGDGTSGQRRARRRAGRAVRHRHQPPREPARRSAAARARRPSGRSRRDAVLSQPRGRPAGALRPSHADPARYLPAPGPDPIDHPVVRREIARAQRIIEGQNFEIRRTLARYAADAGGAVRAGDGAACRARVGRGGAGGVGDGARRARPPGGGGRRGRHRRRRARRDARAPRSTVARASGRDAPTCARGSTSCGWAARTRWSDFMSEVACRFRAARRGALDAAVLASLDGVRVSGGRLRDRRASISRARRPRGPTW